MQLLTKDKSFYRSFFALWRVIVLNHVIVLSVNLADNMMLGAYSEAALSGAAACNQLQFVFQQLILGVSNGVIMMGSQYWGQKQTEPIKRLAVCALSLGAVFSVILFVLAAVMPAHMVGLFTESPAILAEGVEYLRVIKYTYPVFALTNILLAVLRSVESVKIAFRVSLMTLFVNIILNYLLIFGKLGLPAMGSEGAALATLISRVAELAVVLLYLVFAEKRIKLKLRDLKKFDPTLNKQYLRVSFPTILAEGLFGISTALQTVILGHMSDAAIAANSVSTSLYQLLKVVAIGSAAAASVIIGKTIGEGARLEKIRDYTRTLQFFFLCVGAFTGVALFFLRIPIVGFYNISPEAKQLANGFLLVLCVTCIGTSYQMPVNTGIVRGGGDSKFILKVDLISIWCIVLPLSFCAAFWWNWHPIAVIACLNADQVFKCLPAFLKVNRYNWIRILTKQEET